MQTSTRRRAIGAILVFLSLLMVACDNFSLSETFQREAGDPETDEPETDLPLAIFPATAATWTSGILQFVGQGGDPEYTFSVEDADGGTIDPKTGVYTAPTDAGEFSVTVTDQAGDSGLAVVYVVEERPLRISPQSASVALDGDPKEFFATGGEGSYTFDVDPAGVGTVTEPTEGTGVFTPQAPGSTNVIVTDGLNTVGASVFVYEEMVGGAVQLIPDELEIAQRESTGLRIVGGTPDYDPVVVAAGSIANPGADPGYTVGLGAAPWEGQYVAGDAIGPIEITVTDNAADEYTLELTVLPATPTDLLTDNGGSPNEIRLTWEHSPPLPDTDAGFRIYRSSSSAPAMTLVDEVGPSIRQYLDTGVSPSVSYYVYEIVAFTTTPEYISRPSLPSDPTTSKP